MRTEPSAPGVPSYQCGSSIMKVNCSPTITVWRVRVSPGQEPSFHQDSQPRKKSIRFQNIVLCQDFKPLSKNVFLFLLLILSVITIIWSVSANGPACSPLWMACSRFVEAFILTIVTGSILVSAAGHPFPGCTNTAPSSSMMFMLNYAQLLFQFQTPWASRHVEKFIMASTGWTVAMFLCNKTAPLWLWLQMLVCLQAQHRFSRYSEI